MITKEAVESMSESQALHALQTGFARWWSKRSGMWIPGLVVQLLGKSEQYYIVLDYNDFAPGWFWLTECKDDGSPLTTGEPSPMLAYYHHKSVEVAEEMIKMDAHSTMSKHLSDFLKEAPQYSRVWAKLTSA